jgi:Alpha amylase, catalytic domain
MGESANPCSATSPPPNRLEVAVKVRAQDPVPEIPVPWKAVPYPLIYEVNVAPTLDQLSRQAGRRVDLGTVPDAFWDAVAEAGFDVVWLMGVWARSPVGIAAVTADAELMAGFRDALPDFTPADLVGSPYCIRDYVVDDALGGPGGLAAARKALASRGLGLILDFVPNHVAPDHPWTSRHPERFVAGTGEELRANPGAFAEVAGRVLARGKDPYFAPWPDVVQLDAFSPGLRAAMVETLRGIADQCNGVRCDMAMLMMNDTFQRTWEDRVGEPPAEDYWPTVIPAVRETHPGFLFVAEAYWDLEWALLQQGFDYCYDKRLYDRLLHDRPEAVRQHLQADVGYQAKLVRFLENHDEPRAAAVLDPARERAVAVATLTQTGARLVHHGQVEGRRTRLPVFLGRYPDEPPDVALAAFYRSLLAALRDPTFRHGRWRLCTRLGWPGNDGIENLAAWCWEGETRWLVVVNLSESPSAGLVQAPWPDLVGELRCLVDPTNALAFQRSGQQLVEGLYVELGPWGWHLFRLDGPPVAP